MTSGWNPTDTRANRALGAYYRARVLLKDRRDTSAALGLLRELDEEIARDEIGGLNSSDPYESMLSIRVRRLHAQALLRNRNAHGRDLLLDLADRLEGTHCDSTAKGNRLANFLDDLAGDLSTIGDHDRAVSIATMLASRSSSRALHALRASNHAAWLLQRAVARRLSDESAAAALSDLDAAKTAVMDSISAWAAEPPTAGGGTGLGPREARAIALSLEIERATLPPFDTTSAMFGFRELLRETDDAPPWDETYLQRAFRIGRFGMGYTLGQSPTPQDLARGQAYLQLAWDISANALVRPWMPVALHDVLVRRGAAETAREFASEALERLEPQLGPEDPALERLRGSAA